MGDAIAREGNAETLKPIPVSQNREIAIGAARHPELSMERG
ncbi:hypothetical protein [Oxynema sp. CENA135]|nr:hypothetical protein [Oxynema sp. CENA135]